jgi:hypothetical protein
VVELGPVGVAAVLEQSGEIVVAVVVAGRDATAVGGLGGVQLTEPVGAEVPER